jgi:predicted nucleotidyltransferase
MNEAQYEKLIKSAKEDENVIGVILGGSRGKKAETDKSDFDAYVVVQDKGVKFESYGAGKYTLNELDNEIPDWDKYNFAHLKPVIDKSNGELQVVIDKLGSLTDSQADELVKENLDMYTNLAYRSVKNFRDSREVESRIDAAESIAPLLTALFALESRVRPYNKYLVWELGEQPLEKIDSKDFVNQLTLILNGDINAEKKMFEIVANKAEEKGYGKVLSEWGDELDLLKT